MTAEDETKEMKEQTHEWSHTSYEESIQVHPMILYSVLSTLCCGVKAKGCVSQSAINTGSLFRRNEEECSLTVCKSTFCDGSVQQVLHREQLEANDRGVNPSPGSLF